MWSDGYLDTLHEQTFEAMIRGFVFDRTVGRLDRVRRCRLSTPDVEDSSWHSLSPP